MSDLGKLRAEHAQLVDIIRRLDTVIARPGPPPQSELFELRRELSTTLIDHLKNEDWVLYPHLLASADPHIASTARAFRKEMGGLAAAYFSYSEKWNSDSIDSDWPGYCRDSRSVIDALTTRIVRENRELYPLLERAGAAA